MELENTKTMLSQADQAKNILTSNIQETKQRSKEVTEKSIQMKDLVINENKNEYSK